MALYLLGAKRKVVASLVGMPEDSLKTMLRSLQKEGFDAFRDRRHSMSTADSAAPVSFAISLQVDEQYCVLDFGDASRSLKIARSHPVHLKTILLSLCQSGLLTTSNVSPVLGISPAHCRELTAKLVREDVERALVDKRQGQKKDYRVGEVEKAEIIKHFAAQAITGRSTSSRALAEVIHKDSSILLPERTVRWHVKRLGLNQIKKTLPERVEELKKTAAQPL